MTTKPFEFERALKELEEITLWFESTDVDLDQGLVKFERGMELAGHLKDHLATVENRIEKIKQRFSGAKIEASDNLAASDLPAPPEGDQPDLFEV
ncbi:MAG TPA: exodeoxyribonuclease VII small subunit [Candidatus Saccharimonadia bacterium]|nr:exodeoxyribonuclease VII small subunit [Candidatus Saccharimonadia bacterium]